MLTLSLWQVVLSILLMLFVIALAYVLRLRLIKMLVIASIRTVVQLSVIGLILAWVFAHSRWYVVLTVVSIMSLVACVTAKSRVKKPYKGLFFDTCVALMGSGFLVSVFGVVIVLQVDNWYQPEILLPILGLILGNALTAVSLSLNHLMDNLQREREQILVMLSLSATPKEAVQPFVVNAIHQGVMPTINSMMVVGVVSLPGMMTGQILAGASPDMAVRYQIVTMFLIATGSMFSCVLACFLLIRRCFDDYQRFVLVG